MQAKEKKMNFFFFLNTLGIQSPLEIRVFLNPSLLWEHAAQVRQAGTSVLSKELIWQTTQKTHVYHTPVAEKFQVPLHGLMQLCMQQSSLWEDL